MLYRLVMYTQNKESKAIIRTTELSAFNFYSEKLEKETWTEFEMGNFNRLHNCLCSAKREVEYEFDLPLFTETFDVAAYRLLENASVSNEALESFVKDFHVTFPEINNTRYNRFVSFVQAWED